MAKGRILVVDDDEAILELCAETLSGYRIRKHARESQPSGKRAARHGEF